MAYVALSKAVTERILDSIKQMRYDEIGKVNAAYAATTALSYKISDPELLLQLENQVWGEYADIKDRLPKKWCVTSRTVQVCLEPGGVRINLESAVRDFIWPPKTFAYELDVKLPAAQFTPNLVLAESIVNRNTELAAINTRYDTLHRSVSNLLDQYNSLGALVKDHPEIMSIVPEHLKQKLEHKVVRKAVERETKQAEPDTSFDAELLMATFVAHKILTGAS